MISWVCFDFETKSWTFSSWAAWQIRQQNRKQQNKMFIDKLLMSFCCFCCYVCCYSSFEELPVWLGKRFIDLRFLANLWYSLVCQLIVNYLWFLLIPLTPFPSPVGYFRSATKRFRILFCWSSAASVRHISLGILGLVRPWSPWKSAQYVISLKITPGTERNTFNDNSRARKVIILSEFSWGNSDVEAELVSTDCSATWRVLPTHNTKRCLIKIKSSANAP